MLVRWNLICVARATSKVSTVALPSVNTRVGRVLNNVAADRTMPGVVSVLAKGLCFRFRSMALGNALIQQRSVDPATRETPSDDGFRMKTCSRFQWAKHVEHLLKRKKFCPQKALLEDIKNRWPRPPASGTPCRDGYALVRGGNLRAQSDGLGCHGR